MSDTNRRSEYRFGRPDGSQLRVTGTERGVELRIWREADGRWKPSPAGFELSVVVMQELRGVLYHFGGPL